ncbi:Arrestin domain-containing protein 4, partial [Blyttiomyces sp. JEL0837]
TDPPSPPNPPLNALKLPAGRHTWPFSFRVPPVPSLPPTYRGKVGSVRYEAVSTLERPSIPKAASSTTIRGPVRKRVARREIPVRSIETNETRQAFETPVCVNVEAGAGNLWWKAGKVEVRARMPRSGFSFGEYGMFKSTLPFSLLIPFFDFLFENVTDEQIPLTFEITNHSTDGIHLSDVAIEERTLCSYPDGSCWGPTVSNKVPFPFTETFSPSIRMVARSFRLTLPTLEPQTPHPTSEDQDSIFSLTRLRTDNDSGSGSKQTGLNASFSSTLLNVSHYLVASVRSLRTGSPSVTIEVPIKLIGIRRDRSLYYQAAQLNAVVDDADREARRRGPSIDTLPLYERRSSIDPSCAFAHMTTGRTSLTSHEVNVQERRLSRVMGGDLERARSPEAVGTPELADITEAREETNVESAAIIVTSEDAVDDVDTVTEDDEGYAASMDNQDDDLSMDANDIDEIVEMAAEVELDSQKMEDGTDIEGNRQSDLAGDNSGRLTNGVILEGRHEQNENRGSAESIRIGGNRVSADLRHGSVISVPAESDMAPSAEPSSESLVRVEEVLEPSDRRSLVTSVVPANDIPGAEPADTPMESSANSSESPPDYYRTIAQTSQPVENVQRRPESRPSNAATTSSVSAPSTTTSSSSSLPPELTTRPPPDYFPSGEVMNLAPYASTAEGVSASGRQGRRMLRRGSLASLISTGSGSAPRQASPSPSISGDHLDGPARTIWRRWSSSNLRERNARGAVVPSNQETTLPGNETPRASTSNVNAEVASGQHNAEGSRKTRPRSSSWSMMFRRREPVGPSQTLSTEEVPAIVPNERDTAAAAGPGNTAEGVPVGRNLATTPLARAASESTSASHRTAPATPPPTPVSSPPTSRRPSLGNGSLPDGIRAPAVSGTASGLPGSSSMGSSGSTGSGGIGWLGMRRLNRRQSVVRLVA